MASSEFTKLMKIFKQFRRWNSSKILLYKDITQLKHFHYYNIHKIYICHFLIRIIR